MGLIFSCIVYPTQCQACGTAKAPLALFDRIYSVKGCSFSLIKTITLMYILFDLTKEFGSGGCRLSTSQNSQRTAKRDVGFWLPFLIYIHRVVAEGHFNTKWKGTFIQQLGRKCRDSKEYRQTKVVISDKIWSNLLHTSDFAL